MSNKETLGTSAVDRLISRTDYLQPFISKNDKEPSWDGYIIAYNHPGDNHSIEDMAGRVLVQVKSHGCEEFEKESKKFSVKMADLRNYLQEGGTIFFYVYITEDEEIVYYNTLLPYELKKILKDYGHQLSHEIYLNPFPKNKKEISDLVFNFIRDRDMQRAAIHAEDFTLEELQKEGLLKGISFGFTTVNPEYKKNPIDYFFSNDTYIYANLSLGVSLPIEYIHRLETAVGEVNEEVYVGNRLFYSSYKVILKKEFEAFYFGECLKFVYYKSKKRGVWYLEGKGTLKQRIIDVEFLVSAFDENGIIINGKKCFVCNEPLEEEARLSLLQKKEYLDDLRKAKHVFDRFHVKKELKWEEMKAYDITYLKQLISAIDEKNLIPLNHLHENVAVGEYKIGNIVLLVSAIKDEDSGLFRLYDFFDAPLAFRETDANGKQFDSTLCTRFTAEEFLRYDNMDYEAIKRKIVAVPYSEAFENQITLFMLEVLKAFDQLKLPTHPLLGLAKGINEYIREKSMNKYTEIIDLNDLQIKKREGTFGKKDRERLSTLIASAEFKKDELILTGAYLLMDKQIEAKKHYELLSEEAQNTLAAYPIWRYAMW